MVFLSLGEVLFSVQKKIKDFNYAQ